MNDDMTYSKREQLRDRAFAELCMACTQAVIGVGEAHGLSEEELRTIKLRLAADMIEMANRGLRMALPR